MTGDSVGFLKSQPGRLHLQLTKFQSGGAIEQRAGGKRVFEGCLARKRVVQAVEPGTLVRLLVRLESVGFPLRAIAGVFQFETKNLLAQTVAHAVAGVALYQFVGRIDHPEAQCSRRCVGIAHLE